VRGKFTGAQGILFDVGQIRRISDLEAEVDGGRWASSGINDRYVFYVRKIRGLWWVYKERWRGGA
jgi:hypothetical protein